MATRIEAEILIPGSGDPIRNGCVVFDGAILSYAGPIEGAPTAASSDTTLSVPAVMPGLWDCHGHFFGWRNLSEEDRVYTTEHLAVLRSVRDAQTVLRAGFTSVREMGGVGIHLARAINEGTLVGPHVYGAGQMLSITGGHGDTQAYPLEFVRFLANQRLLPGPCDGPAECLKAVRRVLRLGAPVIKVCGSGGVMTDLDDPVHQQFTLEELRAIVEEATRAERIVAAHCHGKPGIMACLTAGVGTIEHGSYLDEEAADLMVAKGAILTPTRWIMTRLVELGTASGMPSFLLEKARKALEHQTTAIRLAARKKIPFALGTDTMCSDRTSPTFWGGNAAELPLLVRDAGLTPLQAIEAGTANGPRTLGPQAPRSGQLRASYVADIIAVRENPLQRIEALTDPENIFRVWKDGKLVVERPFAG